jgi:hypothetical protein
VARTGPTPRRQRHDGRPDPLPAALPHLRESTSTVEQELRLVRAWLDIVGRVQRSGASTSTPPSRRETRGCRRWSCCPGFSALSPAWRRTDVAATADRSGRRPTVGRASTSSDVFSRGIVSEPRLQQIDDRLRALYGEDASFVCRSAGVGPGSEASIAPPLELGEHVARPAA